MKIDFEFQTPHGMYRDALYLPDDRTFTSAEIEVMKTERVNNWIKAIESLKNYVSPFVEIDGITYEKIKIDDQVVLKPVVLEAQTQIEENSDA